MRGRLERRAARPVLWALLIALAIAPLLQPGMAVAQSAARPAGQPSEGSAADWGSATAAPFPGHVDGTPLTMGWHELPDLDDLPALRDALAQKAASATPDGTTLNAAGLAQAAAFDERLGDWSREMEAALPTLDEFVDPGSTDFYRTLDAQIDGLQPFELLILEEQLSQHPAFWELPAFLRSLGSPDTPAPPYFAALMYEWERTGIDDPSAIGSHAAEVDRRARLAIGNQIAAVPTPDATPVADFPDMPEFPPRDPLPPEPDPRPGCPGVLSGNDCAGCPASIPAPAIFALETAITLMNGGQSTLTQFDAFSSLKREKSQYFEDPLDPDTDFCASIIVACICITIPNPAFYVFHSIRLGLQYAVRGLKFQNALASNCQEGLHRALENLYLDATVSSRVTQRSLDDHALLELRVQIENNLLFQADDRISLFQLPATFCGSGVPEDDPTVMTGFEDFRFCGRLELVREVVADRIRQNADAGMLQDVNGALLELAAGDQHYMDGRWRSAYERYSLAYRAATEPEATR